MNFEQFEGPDQIIKKIINYNKLLGIISEITGDEKLSFIHQMLLTTFVATNSREDMEAISKKILEFINEIEMKEGRISARKKLANDKICCN